MAPDGTAPGLAAPVAAYDEQIVPELPELQIVAELVGEAIRGAAVGRVMQAGDGVGLGDVLRRRGRDGRWVRRMGFDYCV